MRKLALPSGLPFLYTAIMKPSIHVEAKRRGRPPGRIFADPIPTRLPGNVAGAIDQWRSEQDSEVSRSEAIRRLLTEHLRAKGYLRSNGDNVGNR